MSIFPWDKSTNTIEQKNDIVKLVLLREVNIELMRRGLMTQQVNNMIDEANSKLDRMKVGRIDPEEFD